MVTKTYVANYFSKTRDGPPTMLSDSDASNVVVLKLQMHPPPRHQISHVLWKPTPTFNIRGRDFGTHIFLGPRKLKAIRTQTFLFAKFNKFILSK